jgi:hypothetical protein
MLSALVVFALNLHRKKHRVLAVEQFMAHLEEMLAVLTGEQVSNRFPKKRKLAQPLPVEIYGRRLELYANIPRDTTTCVRQDNERLVVRGHREVDKQQWLASFFAIQSRFANRHPGTERTGPSIDNREHIQDTRNSVRLPHSAASTARTGTMRLPANTLNTFSGFTLSSLRAANEAVEKVRMALTEACLS